MPLFLLPLSINSLMQGLKALFPRWFSLQSQLADDWWTALRRAAHEGLDVNVDTLGAALQDSLDGLYRKGVQLRGQRSEAMGISQILTNRPVDVGCLR
jgi:hypothetical protein